MRGKEEPFVRYVNGPVSPIIVPRGIRGWSQFGAWLALLVPAIVWLEDQLDSDAKSADVGTAIVLFCIGIAGWLTCGLWWMLARAERVDVTDMRRLAYYRNLKRRRRGKRED